MHLASNTHFTVLFLNMASEKIDNSHTRVVRSFKKITEVTSYDRTVRENQSGGK